MSSYTADSLSWHPVAIFAGAGITKIGALFTYQANWKAPGRWAVEILTNKHRLYLKPLESLQIQKIGSVEIESVVFDNQIDKDFKPGLFKQTECFVNNCYENLVGIQEHEENCKFYERILFPELL
ncbi:hypothetical protein D3C80_1657470 [compost metagenome]